MSFPKPVHRPKQCPSVVVLWACMLAAAPAPAQTLQGGMSLKEPVDFSDRTVTFQTLDGVMIEADYYPVKVPDGTKTPAAILIHMYPADRASWKPLVPLLREAGIAALAYDIRGTGGSTKPEDRKLEEGYDNKDPQHFTMAWTDAEAAYRWLASQRNIDPTRTVLVGASIGCSIALDFAGKQPDLKAVVCLSPGIDYMGLDSINHIKNCSTVPILLIAPKGEFKAVKELKEASDGRAKTKRYPGDSAQHGTKMFEADYGEKVQKLALKFVKKHLGIKDDDKRESDKADDNDNAEKKKKKKPDAA